MVQNIKKYWKFSVVILIAASLSGLFAIFQSPSAIASDETIGVGDLAPGQQIDLTGNSVVLKFCVNTACQPPANVTFQKEGAFSFIARNITVQGATSSCNYDFNIFYNSGDTQAYFKTKQNGEGGLLGCPLKSNTASSPFNVTPADINIKTSAVYETCEVGLSGEEKAACLDGAANSGNTSYCDKYSTGSSLSNACKKGQTAQASDTAATAPSGGATTGSSPGDAGAAAQAKPTCASLADGIGWWVCAPLVLAVGFSDLLWGLMEGLLETNPLTDSGPYYQSWTILRNIANALLAVIFLVVVYSQISNIGISNYGVKKLLPRLLIVAVLVNISFLVVQLSVDLANILGKTLGGLMESLTDTLPAPTWQEALESIINGAAGGAALVGVALVAGKMFSWPAVLLFLAIMIVLAIIGIVVGVLTLVIRNGLIPIIAILAPVAFVAYVLPNTQGLFDKWKKLFFGILFLYPAAALYMGALQFAASLLIANGGIIETIVALATLFVGSAFIPIIALKSNSTMSKIYGGLSNAVGKAIKPAKNLSMGAAGAMASSTAALKFAQFKNQDHSPRKGRGSRGFLGRKMAMRGIGRVAQRFDTSSMARKTAMDAAGVDSQERFKDRLLDGYDPDDPNSVNEFALKAAGGDMQAAREMQRKVHLARKEENLKKASAELTEDFNRARAANPSGFDPDDFLLRQLYQTDANGNVITGSVIPGLEDGRRDAILHRAASLGRDQIISNAQNSGNVELAAVANEAAEANRSSLANRAPDIYKGNGAFENVTGQQFVQFSAATQRRYLEYIGSIQDDTQRSRVMRSFNTAVEDTSRDSTLQASFGPDAGAELHRVFDALSATDPARFSGMQAGMDLIDRNTNKIRPTIINPNPQPSPQPSPQPNPTQARKDKNTRRSRISRMRRNYRP